MSDDQGDWVEASVSVNGKTLTTAEVLTIRVALCTWQMQLAENKDALGTDTRGRSMRRDYLRHLEQVLALLTVKDE